MAKRNELAKVDVNLEAWLKELESKQEEFELLVAKERGASKELEDDLIIYKNEVMRQHEKGFQKAARQAEFFTKDLDLGLFDPFKDVKDSVLLDNKEIATEEEAVNEEQGSEERR